MSSNFNLILLEHIKNVAKENDLENEVVKDFLLDAIKKAYNRITFEDNLELSLDVNSGEFVANKLYEVVPVDYENFDEYLHVEENDERVKELGLKVGDIFKEPFHIEKEFKTNQVQQILQTFKQRITEINNQRVYKSWAQMKNEVIIAKVEKEDKNGGFYTINLEDIYDKNGEKLKSTLGFIGQKELNPEEHLEIGEKYHFVVIDIKEQSKFCPIILSRISNKLVEYYMSLEIPEIDDGTIKIVKSARQAGIKTKVLVESKNLPVEPASVCVGPRGERIKNISSKLNNEKIEIYNYTSNPYLLLSQIIIKYGIVKIGINLETKDAFIVILDDELSKAIGRKGCNPKLASMVSGYNIDIIKMSDFDPNDYDEKFYDIDSSEFLSLCESNEFSNNKTEEKSNINFDEIDDFYAQIKDNEGINELNSIFEDEVNQILENEKEKL